MFQKQVVVEGSDIEVDVKPHGYKEVQISQNNNPLSSTR